MDTWSTIAREAVPQYALKRYGAVALLSKSDDELVVAGYASPQVVDRDKHVITKEALAKDLPRFMAHPHYRNVNLLHCLEAGTKVKTGGTGVHAGDFKNIEDIQVGDRVLTHKGRLRPVTQLFRHKGPDTVVELRLANGETVRLTDEHQILVVERGWVRAGDLAAGDVLHHLVKKGHRSWDLADPHPQNYLFKGDNSHITEKTREAARVRMREIGASGAGARRTATQRRGKTLQEVYGLEKAVRWVNGIADSQRGEKSHFWRGGTNRKGYPYTFGNVLKEFIRDRDGRACVLCGRSETEELERYGRRLSVDHEDWDKYNLDPTNLRSLCINCHSARNREPREMLANGVEVISASVVPFDGWVYNVEVEDDHSYAGKGIIYHNSNVTVGEVLPSWTDPETGKRWETKVDDVGLFTVVKIRTDAYKPPIVDKVINDIRSGKIASFSISADAPFESRHHECVDDTCFWVIDEIVLYEVTVCFKGDEPVWTKTGLKKIKDVGVGDLVWTHMNRWRPVTETMVREVTEDLVRITTEKGIISATSEHPFRLLVHGGRNKSTKYEWVAAKDIRPGDLVSRHEESEFREASLVPIVDESVGNATVRVVSVEGEPYSGKVYNLEVEEDHSYTMQEAVVHNCETPVNQAAKFTILSKSFDELGEYAASSFCKDGSCSLTLPQARRVLKAQASPEAAGLAIVAADTGRVLMLQRALTEGDPAAGTWEFPGGHIDHDEEPYEAAKREWSEEVGCQAPDGEPSGGWTSANGVYKGFVLVVPAEDGVPIRTGDRDEVTNPDDPDGDQLESVAWWDPEHLDDNPALRDELRQGLHGFTGALSRSGLEKNSTAAESTAALEGETAEMKAVTGVGAMRQSIDSVGDLVIPLPMDADPLAGVIVHDNGPHAVDGVAPNAPGTDDDEIQMLNLGTNADDWSTREHEVIGLYNEHPDGVHQEPMKQPKLSGEVSPNPLIMNALREAMEDALTLASPSGPAGNDSRALLAALQLSSDSPRMTWLPTVGGFRGEVAVWTDGTGYQVPMGYVPAAMALRRLGPVVDKAGDPALGSKLEALASRIERAVPVTEAEFVSRASAIARVVSSAVAVDPSVVRKAQDGSVKGLMMALSSLSGLAKDLDPNLREAMAVLSDDANALMDGYRMGRQINGESDGAEEDILESADAMETLEEVESADRMLDSVESKAEAANPGMMVAWFPDSGQAKQLAVTGGEAEDELHLTVAYITDDASSLTDEQHSAVVDVLRAMSLRLQPLNGSISGIGRFNPSEAGGKVPLVALIDVPGLSEVRADLVSQLKAAGVEVDMKHGFSPHLTLMYEDSDVSDLQSRGIHVVETTPICIDKLWLVKGGERTDFSLDFGIGQVSGEPPPDGSSGAKATEPDRPTVRTLITEPSIVKLAAGGYPLRIVTPTGALVEMS